MFEREGFMGGAGDPRPMQTLTGERVGNKGERTDRERGTSRAPCLAEEEWPHGAC